MKKLSKEKILKIAKLVWQILVYVFAAIGFVLVVAYFAVRFGFTNVTGIIDQQRQSFLGNASSTLASNVANEAPEYPKGTPWQNTEEWQVLSEAIIKDAPVIDRAASAAGVSPRLIVADLVVEQLRLFFTERAFYKQFFAPLQILGSQTQFSWGVMGMKEDTAVQVENNLKNPSSPFYPGPQYEHLLDFPGTGPSQTTPFGTPTASSTQAIAASSTIQQERFTRMTDQHNHYYNYLYAALYIKEIETQWQNAGFPITSRPDVISTLYNIGFEHSTPNANPQVGGAAIVINGVTYSFGGLAQQFYSSNLLTNLFPQ